MTRLGGDQVTVNYVISARQKFNLATQAEKDRDAESLFRMCLGDCILALERIVGTGLGSQDPEQIAQMPEDVLKGAIDTVKALADEQQALTGANPAIFNQGLRADAEKQRRGIDILKHKTEANEGAKVCTLSGRPPDPDYQGPAPQPINPATGMHKDYYVLCAEERAKGFVLPVRTRYKHVGAPGPKFPLRDLTPEQIKQAEAEKYGYVKYEPYPEEMSPVVGKYWTLSDLARVNKGCQQVTTMGPALAETYARQPDFYGGTFCAHCQTHFLIGESGEFIWVDINEGHRVGGKEDLHALALAKSQRATGQSNGQSPASR